MVPVNVQCLRHFFRIRERGRIKQDKLIKKDDSDIAKDKKKIDKK